jgi:hypothetical protein
MTYLSLAKHPSWQIRNLRIKSLYVMRSTVCIESIACTRPALVKGASPVLRPNCTLNREGDSNKIFYNQNIHSGKRLCSIKIESYMLILR